MAISLKKYDRQVGVSAQTGTQAISGATASAMIQAAGADAQTLATVAGAAGDVFDVFQKQKEAIRKETEEIQSKNEVQKFNVEYTNMQTALKDSLKDVKNEEEANALINTFTQDVNKLVDSNTYLPQSMQDINYSRIGEDKRFDIEAIAAVGANNTLERINTLELIRAESETGARTEAEFNTATDELIGLSKEYTPAWATKQKADFSNNLNKNLTFQKLTVDMNNDPSRVIQILTEQREGKEPEGSYNGLDEGELKVALNEARQVLGRQQNQQATEFFLNKNYQNLLVSEQIASVEIAIANNNLPEKQGLAEINRLKNNIPLEGKHITELQRAKEDIRSAFINNKEDQISTIIDKYTSDPDLPPQFMSQLMSYALNKTLITERYENPNYKDVMAVFEASLSTDIAKGELITSPNFIMNLGSKIMGEAVWGDMNTTERKEFVAELSRYAMSDFQNAMEIWVSSQPKMPSRQEVRKRAMTEMNRVREKYNTESIASLIDEYNLLDEPVVEPVVEPVGETKNWNDLKD